MMGFLLIDVPKELPTTKVLRYLQWRSIVPISIHCDTASNSGTVLLNGAEILYGGPNLPEQKTNDCMFSSQSNGSLNYPESCWPVMQIITVSTASVVSLLVGFIKYVAAEGESKRDGWVMMVLALGLGIPANILVLINLKARVLIAKETTEVKLIVPVLDQLIDQANENLIGLFGQTEYLVRLNLRAANVKEPGAVLPFFTDAMFAMIDEYRLLSDVKNEDWPYLRMTGKMYDQFKSFESIKGIHKRRDLLRAQIQELEIQILTPEGDVSLTMIAAVIIALMHSGTEDQPLRVMEQGASSVNVSSSSAALFSSMPTRDNPLQIELAEMSLNP
ncbi:hypothetical protein N9C31_00480 [Gammaproteobacteria bacterium]|nr:hypothetical protein [Gammaproteobacteria bacterium]